MKREKILGVCGDSFMSSLVEGQLGHGKHFTEILSKKLNCNIITYARGGCSNSTIRLQIDEIVKHKPTYVIVGTTSPDRLEIPIKSYKTNNYEKQNGLFNVKYDDYKDKSSEHNNFKKIKPTILSQTITNIFNGNFPEKTIDRSQIDAIEKYFNLIHDTNWKAQQDGWVIADGINKLEKLNIDYSLLLMNINIETLYFYLNNFIKSDNNLNPMKYYRQDSNTMNPFHLTDEDEVILSDLWYEKLKNKFL